MKYIYGPVKSRRLGFSLGLTLTPPKVCNLNCIYCQLGRTTQQVNERKEYIPIGDIIGELQWWITNNPQEAEKISCITLSGSGEPTLNSGIGKLIVAIKSITHYPVVLITNSLLLADPVVRKDIVASDIIVPSLDAVTPEIFAKIDRPCQAVDVDKIINGLISLRKEFHGKIWLEVMLIKGVNDDLRHIKKLKTAIEDIDPDKIQINSPVRSTAEEGLLPVSRLKLKKIQEILGERCEII